MQQPITALRTLDFDGAAIPVYAANGQHVMTGPDIARALGYTRPDVINVLYLRHADEFTEEMACLVNLTWHEPSTGRMVPRETRVFNRDGAHLLAMFSKTERAKAFRRWILRVLNEHAELLGATRKFWFARRPHYAPILPLALQGLTYTRIAEQVGRSPASVSLAVRRMTELRLILPEALIAARYSPRTAQRKLAELAQLSLDFAA